MGAGTAEQKPEAAQTSYNVVNWHWLRKQNLPYVFIWVVYYAWVIVFSTWWTASPLTENTFGSELRSIMHSLNLLSSAVCIFIIRKEWFIKTARVGALLIIAGMSVFLAVQSAHAQMAAAVIIAVSLGLVNTSILMPFVFALNNTEKLYAVIGSNILITLLLLFQEQKPGILQSRGSLIFSFIIVLLALAAIPFFKKDCLAGAPKKSFDLPKIHFGAYMMLILSCMFAILGKGAGKGIVNVAALGGGLPLMTLYHIGSLAGCVVYLLIYAFSNKCVYLTWNITFGTLAMGLLLNGFSSQEPRLSAVFSVLVGVSSTMGMSNMYYLLGVIGKKYDSMRYVRFSILFIGICGGVSGVLVGNLITNMQTSQVSLIASVGAAVVALLFIILSPAFATVHYEDEWAKDSEKMEIDNEQLHLFRKYRMSNREIEVCKLLLQGYTMRQISGILSLAYPTVNTYCTNIYRKARINSRAELMQLFKDYMNK